MAPCGLPFLLALEVATSGWPANSSAGNTQTDPRDEHRQPTVGSATDPWRAAQARHRDRTDESGDSDGQAQRSAVPRVEDVPPQSCRRYRRNRSVRRADNLVPSALWFVDHGAWQTTGHMVRSNNASDRGMDRNPDNRSLRMGAASPYLIRDRDGAYGEVFIRRIRSMGIRDQPTSPRSPWQNGYAERLIGSIRRECLDHVVVLGECHLRHLLLSYMKYYNGGRTHLDDATADELVNAFTLKQIWSDVPQFSSFRTKRRDVLIASNKASLLGWTLAVRLVRQSRGVPPEQIIDPDWLHEWLAIPYADPLYWRFIDYVCARIDSVESGALETPPTTRRFILPLKEVGIDGFSPFN